MKDIIVVIGAGSIGQAITRRVSAGKHVLLADLRQDMSKRPQKSSATPGLRSIPQSSTSRRASRFTPSSRQPRLWAP